MDENKRRSVSPSKRSAHLTSAIKQHGNEIRLLFLPLFVFLPQLVSFPDSRRRDWIWISAETFCRFGRYAWKKQNDSTGLAPESTTTPSSRTSLPGVLARLNHGTRVIWILSSRCYIANCRVSCWYEACYSPESPLSIALNLTRINVRNVRGNRG